jgi:glutamine synthetase
MPMRWTLADQVFLFKRTMREAAMRHGVYATFLAKPMENEPGSAMHIHQSLVRVRRAQRVRRRERGQRAPGVRPLPGRPAEVRAEAMAFFAPNVNSYRRLVFGEVSPSNVHWGYDNRTCGLRVPLDTPENMRVESRFAGSDANPYLAMAATLACGLLGIRERLADQPVAGSAKELATTCRARWAKRWLALEQCSDAALLGERFCRAYISVKRKEYETFFRVISSWEREFLLLNV